MTGHRSIPWRASRRPFIGLAATGLYSSLTSYALFVLLANEVRPRLLGVYVFAVSAATLAAGIVDAGDGVLTVRRAVKSSDARPFLAAEARRRSRVSLALAVFVCILVGVRSDDWLMAALSLLLVLSSAMYGFALIAAQAARRYRRLAATQVWNGTLFLIGGAVMIIFDVVTTYMAMGIHILGLGLSARAGLPSGSVDRGLSAPISPSPPGRLGYYRGTAISNTAATQLDTALLGQLDLVTVSVYAAAQRPAFGLSAVSSAVGRMAIPELASLSSGDYRHVTSRVVWFVPGSIFAAAFAYPIGAAIFPHIYPDRLYAPLVFAVIVGAYTLGVAMQITASSLLLCDRERVLMFVSLSQTGILLVMTIIGGLLGSALTVALGVFVARLVSLCWQLALLRRSQPVAP